MLRPRHTPERITPLDSTDFATLGRIAFLTGRGGFRAGLASALDVLRLAAGADACEFFVLDSASGELLLTSCAGGDADAFCSRERFDLGAGFPGRVALSGEPWATRDLAHESSFLRPNVVARGYQSFACGPVVHGDRTIGTIHLAWKQADADLERAARLLDAAGHAIAAALYASDADMLRSHGHALPSSGDHLTELAARFRDVGGADAATVVLFDDAAGSVSDCGSTGAEHLVCRQLARSGPAGCARLMQASRPTLRRGERAAWPKPCRGVAAGYEQFVEIPLRAAGRIVGVVFLVHASAPPLPHTRHFGQLSALAHHIATRIQPPVEPQHPPATVAAVGPRLRLQCLGPFAVYVNGRLVHPRDFVRTRAIELLKYLVAQGGRAVSRDRLIEHLWPGTDIALATRNLHVTMHALRRVIEPEVEGHRWAHIRTQEDRFLFDHSSSCFVDLSEFQTLVAQSHKAHARGCPADEVMDLLDRAISLYRGDLFEDAPDAEWAAALRGSLRASYLDTLLRLADLSGSRGTAEHAISLYRQASDMDPLREDVQRRLIRALWEAGRRREARARYDACVDALRTVLGIAPTIETRRLGEMMGRSVPA